MGRKKPLNVFLLLLCVAAWGNEESNAHVWKRQGAGCPADFFHCIDGTCIEPHRLCDGVSDCPGGMDEGDCAFRKCEAPQFFQCANKQCVSSYFVCDGQNDCGDFSEEKNCEKKPEKEVSKCDEGDFRCKDGLCIPKEWVCDKTPDCLDLSDEIDGCISQVECNGFVCSEDNECIASKYRCDGIPHCSRGSDEINCPKLKIKPENCLMATGHFLCNDNKTCLEHKEVCNSIQNCPGGEDEGGKCVSHELCKTSRCSHSCLQTPAGATCFCPSGYKLTNNKCKDIDECAAYGVCSQKCSNTDGGFSCLCEKDYKLAANNFTCEAQGTDALLLFSSKREIRGYYLKSHMYFPIQTNLEQVVGVAYDSGTGYVYWTNIQSGQESIMRSKFDGTKKEEVVSKGLILPEDLAIDWVTHNVYFTDPGKNHIAVCTEDGSSCTVVVMQNVEAPRAIVVIPQDGTLFWSDWGAVPHIGRAGMDGSLPTVVVGFNLHWPNGLTVDYSNSRLYWVDAKLYTIESIRLDGEDRRVVLDGLVQHPYSIAVFEDQLYWSDLKNKEIQSCEKFTGKGHHVLLKEPKRFLFGIHIYHPALQPQITNPCYSRQCSHLCLLTQRGGGVCACPSEMELSIDQHTCRDRANKTYVVIGVGKKLVRLEHQAIGHDRVSELYLPDIKEVGALAYNSLTDSLFISDSVAKKIFTFDLKTHKTSVLVDSQIGNVKGMDFDSESGALIWVDAELEKVEAMSLASKKRVTLFGDLKGEAPLDVSVLEGDGMLFLSMAGENPHIDGWLMDGTHRVHLVEDSLTYPSALTLDQSKETLFWVNIKEQTCTISKVPVTGHNKPSVWSAQIGHVTDVAVLNGQVYWADNHSGTIYWQDLDQKRHAHHTSLETDGKEIPRVVAVIPHAQNANVHPCRKENGGCSHVCVAFPKRQVCICPTGYSLGMDGKICILNETCPANSFHCINGACVSENRRCDGIVDCVSGEDEEGCSAPPPSCHALSFQCGTGQCLAPKVVCDGTIDCADGTDEANCTNSNEFVTCKEGEFQCISSKRCINATWRCDLAKDCPDNSDEQGCDKVPCSKGKFRCLDGFCIPDSSECNGYVDCLDGSDEHRNCKKAGCNEDQFECTNGFCVNKGLVCDGHNDCSDGSDETCQDGSFTCKLGYFACRPGSRECIPMSSRCNGTIECASGEDENGCTCEETEFRCDTGECISESWVCDGRRDCLDSSDEDVEACRRRASNLPEPVEHKVGSCHEYSCRSGQCISWNKVCNGKNDCVDGSDEGQSCDSACSSHICEMGCRPSPLGPHCYCPEGYTLSSNGRDCNDVDECTGDSRCSQICKNSIGGYKCTCAPDYYLAENGQTCSARGPAPELLFGSLVSINKVSLNLQKYDVVLTEQQDIIQGIAVDSETRELYWTTAVSRSIYRMPVEKGPKVSIKNLGFPQGIVLDWITKNVYYSEVNVGNHELKVCNLDVGHCAKILSVGTAFVNTLAVDPKAGWLFWSQKWALVLQMSKSQIWRSGLDGSDAVAIVPSSLASVSGLALDLIVQRVYWCDKFRNVVESSNYNGGDRRTLYHKEVHHPIGLVAFEGALLWLEQGTGHAVTCHKLPRRNCTQLELHSMDARFFVMLQPALQPKGANPCSAKSCSYLCVLSPHGAKCLCPSKMYSNGTNCVTMDPKFLPLRPTTKPEEDWTDVDVEVVSSTEVVHRDNINILNETNLEDATQFSEPIQPGTSAGTVVAVILILAAIGAIAFLIYWKLWKRKGNLNLVSLHFKNPTFGYSSESEPVFRRNSGFSPPPLDDGQYENPTYNMENHDYADVASGKLEITFPESRRHSAGDSVFASQASYSNPFSPQKELFLGSDQSKENLV